MPIFSRGIFNTHSPFTFLILNWENLGTGTTYYIGKINSDGSSTNLQTLNIPTGDTLTTTITNLTNGELYRFVVYVSTTDMVQVTAIPIGPPKDLSVSNNGSNFTVSVNFNGDTKVYITILGITSDTVEVMGPGEYTDTVNTIIGASSLYLKYVVIVSNSIGSIKLQSE